MQEKGSAPWAFALVSPPGEGHNENKMKCYSVFAQVVLTSSFLFSFASQAGESTCSSLDEKELKVWAESLGTDPNRFLDERLKPLHQALNEDFSKLGPYPKQQILSHFQSGFALSPWLDRLPSSLANSTTAQSYTQLWLLKKYLGLVRKSAFRAEVVEFSLRGRSLPEDRRSRILNFPASPQIYSISRFRCERPEEQRRYDCSQNLFLVQAHLGADLLCGKRDGPEMIAVNYLVLQGPQGLRILDVLRGQTALFAQSLENLERLSQSSRRPELLRWFSQVTFTLDRDLGSWGLQKD